MTYCWTSTGPPIGLAGAPDRRLVTQVDVHSARLGLVRSRVGRLDDDRVPELGGGRDAASPGVAARALADERQAVGGQQRAHLARLEPDIVGRRERSRSTTRGRGLIDAIEIRSAPAGRRSHAARRAASPSARAADSG